jgi:hypothetical protein
MVCLFIHHLFLTPDLVVWTVLKGQYLSHRYALMINCLCFQGDILFLHMSKDPIRTGEIVVFNVDVSPIYPWMNY